MKIMTTKEDIKRRLEALELNKNKSNEDWEAFENGEGLNLSNQLKGYELAEKKIALIKKNILDEIDNRIKLHSLVLIKNKMKYNQFLDYRQHSMKSLREGLREAKNIIMKEFGELE